MSDKFMPITCPQCRCKFGLFLEEPEMPINVYGKPEPKLQKRKPYKQSRTLTIPAKGTKMYAAYKTVASGLKTSSAVAHKTGLDPTNVSSMLGQLERRGVLSKVKNGNNVYDYAVRIKR